MTPLMYWLSLIMFISLPLGEALPITVLFVAVQSERSKTTYFPLLCTVLLIIPHILFIMPDSSFTVPGLSALVPERLLSRSISSAIIPSSFSHSLLLPEVLM